MIEQTPALEKLKLKLQRANEIISNIATTEKYITPVTPDDHQLFEDFFAKEERHTYGNSWIYVTQGVCGIGPHNLGYKYYDGENLCMLGISPKIEYPEIIMLYWIRPLGAHILEAIVDYAERIRKKYGIASYVKKIFPDQFDFLLQKGFKSSKEFPWHSVSHSEDDTYPELILHASNILSVAKVAGKRSNLGRSFRESNKLASRHSIVTTAIDFEKHAWMVAKQYFENYFLNRKKNFSCEWDYYNTIFNNSQRPDLVHNVVQVDSVPSGFYVLEQRKDTDTANLHAMLVLKNVYRYLPDWILLKILEHGFKHINLGGSEDSGIHNFKLKYKPEINQVMHWATNYVSE